jgi:hypothetical protein
MQVKPESNSHVIYMGGPTIPNIVNKLWKNKRKKSRAKKKSENGPGWLVINLNELATKTKFCWTKVDICANHDALQRQV